MYLCGRFIVIESRALHCPLFFSFNLTVLSIFTWSSSSLDPAFRDRFTWS
jgi:hypothetical protein